MQGERGGQLDRKRNSEEGKWNNTRVSAVVTSARHGGVRHRRVVPREGKGGQKKENGFGPKRELSGGESQSTMKGKSPQDQIIRKITPPKRQKNSRLLKERKQS